MKVYSQADQPRTTVRIRPETHRRLRELAAERGQSLQDVLAEAVDFLWREHLLDVINAGYRGLREDAEGWREELVERTLWEATLEDNQESK